MARTNPLQFIQQVRAETAKVVWPTRREVGLTTVMVLASITHAVRGEPQVILFNAILGGLAAFVAWGRGRKAPITPRA